MAKRFTDTDKFKDPWFRNLSPKFKTFFYFVVDDCNHAGIWKENFAMFEFFFGIKLTHKDMELLGEKFVRLNEETYFLPSFVKFQYGALSHTNKAHQGVLKSLSYYNIETSPFLAPSKPLVSPCQGVQDKEQEQDKDKDKDKEKDKEKRKKEIDLHPWILEYQKITGKKDGGAKQCVKLAEARVKDGFTLEDCALVVNFKNDQWRNDDKMRSYIFPSTLFSNKFETYLDQAKNSGAVSRSTLEDRAKRARIAVDALMRDNPNLSEGEAEKLFYGGLNA